MESGQTSLFSPDIKSQLDQNLSFEKCLDCVSLQTLRAASHFHISKSTELDPLVRQVRKHLGDEEEDTSLLLLVLQKLPDGEKNDLEISEDCGTPPASHRGIDAPEDLGIKEEWDEFKEDGDEDEDYEPPQANMGNQISQLSSSSLHQDEDKKEEKRRKKAARDRIRERGKVWLCEECGKEFSCRSTRWRHVLKVHQQDPQAAYGAQSKALDYECPICGLSMHVKKYAFTLHRQTCEAEKTGVNPFICAICGKSFAASAQLSNHKYTCSAKRKEFYMKSKHRFACTCPGCNYKTEKKKDLENHINRVHLDQPSEKKFVCPTCGNFYVNPSVLKNHIKTVHEGIKPWECSYCGKTFSKKISWSKHVEAHTGEAAWSGPVEQQVGDK